MSWTDKHIDASGSLAFFRGIMHVKGELTDGRKMDVKLRHTLVFKKINGNF